MKRRGCGPLCGLVTLIEKVGSQRVTTVEEFNAALEGE